MATKRKDKNRIVLRKGESYRQNEGRYVYRWEDGRGKRRSVYAKTLNELREKEKAIDRDIADGISYKANTMTLNDIFEIWKGVKRGLREGTFTTYCYLYERYASDSLGKRKISTIKKTDVKRLYISLIEGQGLSMSTVKSLQNVVHQLLGLAVDDDYIRSNPSDGALREIRKSAPPAQKRGALTESQERTFLNYMLNHTEKVGWYPVFAVMIGTGLRAGEVTGLRWRDVDLENGTIDINHALVRIPRFSGKEGGPKLSVRYEIGDAKTLSSHRVVPMLDFVKEAFIMEQEKQQKSKENDRQTSESYDDFVFTSRSGAVRTRNSLNDALKIIIRDCNRELIENKKNDELLPDFTCHWLRHTFATRMCEKGVNAKVIQDILGHSDISITMNIYTDVTKDMKKQAFDELNKCYGEGAKG